MNSKLEDDIDEQEATTFAMELLMPVKFIKQDVQHREHLSPQRVQELADKYGVDELVMRHRLIYLKECKEITVVFTY